MLQLVVPQQEGAGEGIDHGRAGPGLLAAFQTNVVVDADPGQSGQFLAAQPGRTAQAGTGRQADVLRGHPGPAGAQEAPQLAAPADLLLAVHVFRSVGPATSAAYAWGALPYP